MNHCLNMRFYGSAMPFPHIQGAFQEYLVAEADQCVVADGLTAGEGGEGEGGGGGVGGREGKRKV